MPARHIPDADGQAGKMLSGMRAAKSEGWKKFRSGNGRAGQGTSGPTTGGTFQLSDSALLSSPARPSGPTAATVTVYSWPRAMLTVTSNCAPLPKAGPIGGVRYRKKVLVRGSPATKYCLIRLVMRVPRSGEGLGGMKPMVLAMDTSKRFTP
jgi:hypothetical protein